MQRLDHATRSRGWLRYLERKLSLAGDDWSHSGTPAPAWDNISGAPTTSWYRFDAIGVATTYALAAQAATLPTDAAVAALDALIERLCRYHGFNEWVEQRGPDPERGRYPVAWRGTLIPEALWGGYDTPGWAGNGAQPGGYDPNPIEAKGAIYYKGFLNYVLGLRTLFEPTPDPEQPLAISYDADVRFRYSHADINEAVKRDFEQAAAGAASGLCCEIHKLWPL